MNEETVRGPLEHLVGRLERYGIVWKSPTLPICALREDGHWTPWHVAQAEIDSLRAENERLRDALSDCASGLRYVRETYGALYGVGFDRALSKADAARSPQTQSLGRAAECRVGRQQTQREMTMCEKHAAEKISSLASQNAELRGALAAIQHKAHVARPEGYGTALAIIAAWAGKALSLPPNAAVSGSRHDEG